MTAHLELMHACAKSLRAPANAVQLALLAPFRLPSRGAPNLQNQNPRSSRRNVSRAQVGGAGAAEAQDPTTKSTRRKKVPLHKPTPVRADKVRGHAEHHREPPGPRVLRELAAAGALAADTAAAGTTRWQGSSRQRPARRSSHCLPASTAPAAAASDSSTSRTSSGDQSLSPRAASCYAALPPCFFLFRYCVNVAPPSFLCLFVVGILNQVVRLN